MHARHLIGGEMTYHCLGNGDYEIDLAIYRDCAGGGAPFDSLISIAIYQCGGDINCTNLSQEDAMHVLNIPLSAVSSVDIDLANPCLIPPPNVCIELGKYNFKLSDFNVNLPMSDDSYHIVYQRCCRGESIVNLNNSKDFGNTFTIEITPKSQALCNSSPQFNQIPPFILCSGENINITLTATDREGDSLVYNFSPIISGGGTEAANNQLFSCNSPLPTPPCPPPFNLVPFADGFSVTTPFGDVATPVSINPHTGIISGIMPNLGQYAYSITVSEYRNGVFLGITQFETQSSVANCTIVHTDNPNCISTSVNEATSNTHFEISPNPISDYFSISSLNKNISPFSINIYGFNGQLIVTHKNIHLSQRISTAQLNKGMYLVEIKSEGLSYFEKMVKF
jgi:hypothetical protein